MGAVYEARQTDLGRRVAIKLLHPFLADREDLLTRFKREAMAAAALGHPNIVAVTDFCQTGTEPPFLVMEYLEGKTLKGAISKHGVLDGERVAFIASQVLSALEAAHTAGIIHRDLKPENVFLTSIAGMKNVVKVLDFGLAKHNQSEGTTLTASGALLGTPAYMAPEQISGDAVTPATDVYALGSTMYHALTGRLPFQGDNQYALIYSIMETRPPGIASVRPELDPRLIQIVERAMQPKAAARYQSAREMRIALAPFAGAMAGLDDDAPTVPPLLPPSPGGSGGQTVVSEGDAQPGEGIAATVPSLHAPQATPSPRLAPPTNPAGWGAPAPSPGPAPSPAPMAPPIPGAAAAFPVPVPVPVVGHMVPQAIQAAAPVHNPYAPVVQSPSPGHRHQTPGPHPPPAPMVDPGRGPLRLLGKIFGYGMLGFGVFWLILVPWMLLDGDPSAALGGIVMGLMCGVPGGLVTYFVRRADKRDSLRSKLLGFMHSHDAFTAGELAPKWK
jgi:serine/threonine-protein kinase